MGVFDADGINLSVTRDDPNRNLDAIRYQGLTEQVDKFAPGFIKRLDRKLPGDAKKPVDWDEAKPHLIQTEPVNPASEPPYNPLLDADRDGKNDDSYRSGDSPVD